MDEHRPRQRKGEARQLVRVRAVAHLRLCGAALSGKQQDGRLAGRSGEPGAAVRRAGAELGPEEVVQQPATARLRAD